MTEEQIKSLKKGDKFTVEYTVASIEPLCEGELYVRVNQLDVLMQPFPTESGKTLQAATLVTPPPTFEVGDTVRIVNDPLTRTIYGFATEFQPCIKGKEGKVVLYTANRAECHVRIGKCEYDINIHCLELVKKAEKNWYFVKEDIDSWDVKAGYPTNYGTVVAYSKNNYTNARAAAEAECARLNAEWRKQQEGGAE